MGLDQFAYAINKNGEKRELAYWRKHPNLQGWMERVWKAKGCPNASEDYNDFNCVPVELTKEDLNDLEKDILDGQLPDTVGFFFGNDSDTYYGQQDLQFVKDAREALDNGETVMYDSWW